MVPGGLAVEAVVADDLTAEPGARGGGRGDLPDDGGVSQHLHEVDALVAREQLAQPVVGGGRAHLAQIQDGGLSSGGVGGRGVDLEDLVVHGVEDVEVVAEDNHRAGAGGRGLVVVERPGGHVVAIDLVGGRLDVEEEGLVARRSADRRLRGARYRVVDGGLELLIGVVPLVGVVLRGGVDGPQEAARLGEGGVDGHGGRAVALLGRVEFRAEQGPAWIGEGVHCVQAPGPVGQGRVEQVLPLAPGPVGLGPQEDVGAHLELPPGIPEDLLGVGRAQAGAL